MRPLNRRTARTAREGGKANLRWRCLEEGMNEEALPSPFTTLLQIDSASAAATEIIAALCHSHPQGSAGGTPSLIHHNKSIARGQKMNVSMEGAA